MQHSFESPHSIKAPVGNVGSREAKDRALRIAVLVHNLRTAGGMSVGKNLAAALLRRGPENRYLFVIPKGLGYEGICEQAEGGSMVAFDRNRGGLGRRAAFDILKLPKLVQRFQSDWVLGLGNTGLFNPPCRQAILYHNAYYCYPTSQLPRETWKTNLRYFLERATVRLQLPRSDLLLCQTTAYEQRIRRTFGFDGEAVICPNAISMYVRDTAECDSAPHKLDDFRDRYKFFYVARYYNHKNLEILVDLFERFRRELADCLLVITIGADQHPNAAKLLKAIEDKGLTNQILNVGPLRQAEMGAYFQQCQALLMPSLLESFSGTYLEAMHYGLPILTSDRDFARAVCGEAALYFDPLDTQSIYQTIARLRGDEQLAHTLRKTGRGRLQEFPQSWDTVADRILERLVRSPRRDSHQAALAGRSSSTRESASSR